MTQTADINRQLVLASRRFGAPTVENIGKLVVRVESDYIG